MLCGALRPLKISAPIGVCIDSPKISLVKSDTGKSQVCQMFGQLLLQFFGDGGVGQEYNARNAPPFIAYASCFDSGILKSTATFVPLL